MSKPIPCSAKISGFADPRNKKADIRIFNKTPSYKSSFLTKGNLKSSFDSIWLNKNIDKSGGELHIDGFTSITNFRINHPKIASKDVVIKMQICLSCWALILYQSTAVPQCNSIRLIPPYMSYNTEADTIYKLKLSLK
jgi:hypothetical protein